MHLLLPKHDANLADAVTKRDRAMVLTFDRYGHRLPSLDEQLGDGLNTTFTESLTAWRRQAHSMLVRLDAKQATK